MSWRDATLYVATHDLACWTTARARSWGPDPLVSPTVDAARDLLVSVGLALTFVTTRADDLERADRAVVRLRLVLRLAADADLVSAGGLRFAEERLDEIGRMIGGWRRRLGRREEARRLESTDPGDGPPRRRAREPRRQLQERRG